MRFVVLLLSVLLISCATPKEAPQAYYGGVYVPGKVEIQSNGRFESTASVISKDDLDTARKAAYARFMLSAKSKGYRTFKVIDEKTTSALGKSFRLVGKAYKSRKTGGGVYELDAIKRLLKDLPLAKPKPVVKPKRKPAPKPVASKPASIPATEQLPTEEPTVIMAPTDITGSVKKTVVSSQATSSVSTGTGVEFEDPSALSNVPKGVILRSN